MTPPPSSRRSSAPSTEIRPSKAKAAPVSGKPLTPAIAPLVPSVAPLAPSQPPLPPASAAAKKSEPKKPVELPLEEEELPLLGDEPLDGDEPFGGADETEIPIEFESRTEAPGDAIDLPLDTLIADTPPPSADLDFDFSASADEEPLELAFDPRAKGAAKTAPPSRLRPPRSRRRPRRRLRPTCSTRGTSSRSPRPPRRAGRPRSPRRRPRRRPLRPPRSLRRLRPPAAVAKPAAPVSSMPSVRRDAKPAEPEGPPPQLDAKSGKPEAPAPRKSGTLVFLKPPEKIATTGPVIGIDLGTTNSCVGILQNGKPIVMRSKQGYNTLPSIVSVTPAGKLLVAHPAKNQMLLNPTRTIYGAKRLVGRPFDSPTVREVRERFHYEICPDDAGRAAVRLGADVLSLEEVQGLILRECKEMAEREMNVPVSRAVVTVPAYYSEPQREAVRKAGALAGLQVERILNEPTAAALAFGMNRELSKKVLVYDLGGGTFDATLLKIEKNVFEVLATGGDTFLGGVDFDNAIVDLLLQKFQQSEKVQFSGDSVALSRVSDLAEKAKCALSERASYDVHVPMLMMNASTGAWHDLRCTLTRDEVNAATLGMIDRTLDAVRDVLLDGGVKPADVDDVILVGGQSRMPLVREKLKELFGKPAQASVNADEAVALGAALYSGSVDKVSSVVLIDVLPMTVGVGLPGGGFKRVLERNTPLPAQRSFSLPTTRDNDTTIEFEVFQGEDTNVAGNEYLGTVRIEGLPKAPKGMVKVAVTLRLDPECVLHAEAVDLQTRKAVRATLATRYTSDEVQKKLGVTAEQVKKANESREKDLKSRGGGFWGFLEGRREVARPRGGERVRGVRLRATLLDDKARRTAAKRRSCPVRTNPAERVQWRSIFGPYYTHASPTVAAGSVKAPTARGAHAP